MAGRNFRLTTSLLILLIACRDEPTGTRPETVSYRLRIAPDTSELLVGDSLQLAITLTDSKGSAVVAPIAWASSDTSVASVGPDGRVAARGIGSALIVATALQVADTARVAVRHVLGCSAQGLVHSGQVDTATWTARQSPHFISDSLIVTGRLLIQPGTVVCGRPNSIITVRGGQLHAIGTAERPIRFVASDSTRGWKGITAGGYLVGGDAILNHVSVQFADLIGGTIQIDSSRLRRTSVTGTIRHSLVDTGDVALHGGTFEETTIRAGQLTLYHVSPLVSGDITVNGGRIEDSPGVALTIGSTFSFRVPNVTVLKPPVISRSKGGIALMPSDNFFALWPTPDAQAALLDNIDKTISLWSSNFGDLDLRAGLGWRLFGPVGVPAINNLTVRPGGTLTLVTYFNVTGALLAAGTSDQPISISSTVCQGPPSYCGPMLKGTASSRLSHVTFTDATFAAREQNVVQMDHIRTNGSMNLSVAGSSIRDSEIHDVRPGVFGHPALVLGADNVIAERVLVRMTREREAIRIAGSGVKLLSCEVTDNSDDGVIVSSGSGVEIHDCAFERNGGVGVKNETTTLVDAQRNWWGDPGGPLAAGGDGVKGLLDFSRPLTMRPASRAAAVARISITSSQPAVATSDTARFAAIAFDSEGRQIPGPLIWSVADTTVAFVAPKEDGLVVGAHAGATTVTAASATNPTVRASVALTVTPGAPLYRWSREPISMTGRATLLSAADHAHMFAVGDTWQSAVPVYNTSTTCCLLRREGTAWNVVPGPNVTGTPLLSVAPGGQAFFESNDSIGYYDGESFRRLAPKPSPNLYQLAATGADEVYMAGDKGRLWRYHNGRVDLVVSDSTLANAEVFARSPSEVYFLATDFNAAPFVPKVFKWDGKAWTRLPDPPRAFSISADDRYVYTGGYRFDGTRWELMPGVLPNDTYAVYPVSKTLMVLTRGPMIYLYDGMQVRTLWAGERLTWISGMWTSGNEIFIATGRNYILRGVPE